MGTLLELNHSPASKREVLVAITAACSGLSLGVAASLQHFGSSRVGWPTFRRRRALTLASLRLTKGGQLLPSTRALVVDGVLVGRT